MNIRANKKLGQNFLKSKKALDKIVQLAQIQKNDLILEIGPGTGMLTKPLIDNGAQVITIEKDPRMEQILLEKISSHNLQIVIGDIREYYNIFLKNNQEDFKIIANIPYYLSSFLIRMIFNESRKPGIIVLMVQKEWAQRISLNRCQNNKLAMFGQLFFDIQYALTVDKESFSPAPKIDSAIIKMTLKKEREFEKDFLQKYEKMVNACFMQPRKILISNLKNYYSKDINYEEIFAKINIDLKSRPEQVEFSKYMELIKLI